MTQETAIRRARAHVPRFVSTEHVLDMVHGTHRLGQVNKRLALLITDSVGSMWCAYAFAVLALISLPAALQSHSPIVIVGWIAQTFLQLVLLPIIIVGQNVQAAATEGRAEADHETLIAVHALTVAVHTINEHQTEILDLLVERTSRSDAG